MEQKGVIIFGTDAEARIALDILNESEVFPLGFISDDPEKTGSEINDVSIFGTADDEAVIQIFKKKEAGYLIAAGDIEKRKEWVKEVKKLTKELPGNGIHPASWLSPYVKMGYGNIISAFTAIQADVLIGNYNSIHSQVAIETDVNIGHYCTISAGVRIGGNVKIKDEVFIGTGAVIHAGVTIGKGCYVAAGSVVFRSLEPGDKVMGNPATGVGS